MPETPMITWTLNLDQANLVLAVLGGGLNSLMGTLQSQAGEQIQKLQQSVKEGEIIPPKPPNGDARPAAG